MREQAHAGPECQLCPICALVRAVGGTQPEVVDHLASAARELALALRATLDTGPRGDDQETHLDGHRPGVGAHAGGDRLERIRID